MTKPLLEVLKGKNIKTPPIWLMRQAGRYLPEYRELRKKAGSFLTMCYTPEYASEVTLQPIRRFCFDAAIIFSDILVIPDAMGVKLEYRVNEGPVLEKLSDRKALSRLKTDRISSHLSPVFEALDIVSKSLPEHTTLIGFAGAPWTVATYMVEGGGSKHFSEVKQFAYTDPEGFGELIDILVETTVEYLCGQIEAGAEVLQLFDSWAGVLSEDAFKRWVITPAKDIIEKVKGRYPDIPIIAFPKGAAIHLREYTEAIEMDGVGIDYTIPRNYAREQVSNDIALQGNLDPSILIAGGEMLDREIEAILEAFKDRPFIFNLGHGILPSTPIEHVEQLLNKVRNS